MIQKYCAVKGVGKAFVTVGTLVFAFQMGSAAFAETAAERTHNEADASTYKSDNTGRNVRDRNDTRVTADDQNMGGTEVQVLANIRREILANTTLSTNGRNVKIVVENKKVILRGPVESAAEKSWIEGTTAKVASGYVVVNQLEISPG